MDCTFAWISIFRIWIAFARIFRLWSAVVASIVHVFLGFIDRLSEHIGMETKRTLQIFVGRRVQRQNCHRTGAFCFMLPNKRNDHSVDDLWHCGHSKPPAELDICGFSYYTDGSVLTAPEPDNTTIPTIKSARRSS